MKRRSFLASGLAAAALAPARALAQFRGFQQPLTLGVNAPLSGNGQALGQQLVAGVQIAIDYANQFSPMLNSAFTLRMFDNGGTYSQLVNAVQFAGSDPTVVGMIVGFDGDQIAQALPRFANSQMPVLVPATTADAVTQRGYRVIWRLPTKDYVEGQLFARFINGRLHPKMAIAVAQDGMYGSDVMTGFTDQAHSSKFNADGYSFPSDKPDFAAAAKRIMGRSPDLVFLCGASASLGQIIPALLAAGYTGKFGACEGFYNLDTPQRWAKAFTGGYVSTSFPPLDRIPGASQQLQNFRTRSNITIAGAFGYAAAQILMAAVRRTGAMNRLSTMSALQAPGQTYTTLVGDFLFAPTGDPVDPNVYFYTVEKDGFSYYGPSHVSASVL